MVVSGIWMRVPVGVPACSWPVLQHAPGGLDVIVRGDVLKSLCEVLRCVWE